MVQTLLDRQIPAKKVLDLVMAALERPPKSDALSKYYEGNKTLEDIMRVLHKVYGGQTSYIALQLELCNMQQAYGKLARAFYQGMMQVIVQIQEKHVGHLKEYELANSSKDVFYNGLREEYKLLIAHLKDKPGVKLRDLLQEVGKIEEMEQCKKAQHGYPPSVLAKSNYKDKTDGYNSSYKNHHYQDKKAEGIGVRMVNDEEFLEEDELTSLDDDSLPPEKDLTVWKDGYYYCMLQQADETDRRTDTCYNCRESGHHWQECTWPLKAALQKAKGREGIDEKRLNTSGDGGQREPAVPPRRY